MAKVFGFKGIIFNRIPVYFFNGEWRLAIHCKNQEFAKYWQDIAWLSLITTNTCKNVKVFNSEFGSEVTERVIEYLKANNDRLNKKGTT